jgi:hypothetical protein
MPMTRSTATRAVALMVAVAIAVTGFVAGSSPANAAAPTVAPTIIGPDGSAEGENPILQWEPIAGVTKYRVQVSSSPSFSGSHLWSADTYNVSATPIVDLPLGTVHWRVAGMDGSTPGPFATASFTRDRLPGPQLVAPANGSTLEFPSEPVVLRWEPVPGVKNYKIEVDDAPDFIGVTPIITDATNWALLRTQSLGQEFYWRVQGQGATDGVSTEYSPTWHYELDWSDNGTSSVPVLQEPAAGGEVTDVVFRWSPVTGAATYQLQVSPNGDWANNVTIDKTVMGTSYSPAVTLNNASYFWRVRAITVSHPGDPGDAGPWSPDGRQFTRSWADVPTLRAPDDGDLAADDFLLRWDPVPFASAYEVNLGTDPNFSPGTFQTCTTNHTDWAPYFLSSGDPALPPRPGSCGLADSNGARGTYLRHGVRYYWRVRGLDQSNANLTPTVLGRFSDVFDFLYLPDGADVPTPIAPAQGSTVDVPTLRWEPVRGAERYQITIDVNGDRVQEAEVWGTSYTPSLTVTGNSTVAWTIRSLQYQATGGSSASGAGPTVDAGTFTLTSTESGGGLAPDLVSPTVGASTVSPDFDWAPVAGATRYEVRLFPAGSSVYTNLVDHNEGTGSLRRHPWRSAMTPTEPIVPGDYEWQVVAYTLTSQVSSARRAITIDPLPVATPTAPANCGQGSSCTVERSTPLMRWNPVPGAAYYRVRIALDPEFTNIRHVYTTTQSNLRPTEALPDNQAGQSYYWFVQPCRSATVCGRNDSGVWNTARAFRKASRPIAPVSPADGSRVADLVTFTWRAPSFQWVGSDANDDVEARTYKIQVSTTSDFSSILDTAEVDQRTYTPFEETYPEGPLYWRVQARDASGNYLTFSATRSVIKASPRPVITSPSNGDQVNGLPVVQWQPQAFAASWEVEYYNNGDVTWASGNRRQITKTDLTADTLLQSLPVGSYAYRVRRIDADGLAGPWSSDPPPGSSNPADGDRRTFQVVGGAPSPTSPANGASFSRPRVRLEWESVPGAAAYKVETATTNGFNPAFEVVNSTVMTAWSLVKQHPNGTIFWRVHALNARGAVIGTSATRSFTHDLTRPTAAITSATAGSASARITWTATASTTAGPFTSFVVTPYLNGTTAGTPITVPGSARAATVTGLVNNSNYKFTVTPYDGDGVGTESPKSATVTPRAVAPFTSVDAFVIQQFQDFWGRRPTSAELTQYRNQINGGTAPSSVINSLWTNAAGHANVMPQITRLYSAFYLRIPDADGLLYWAGERRKGVSLITVANKFAQLQEFRTLYGQLSNAQFVDLVYENVLERPASTTDRNYWTAELNSGRRSRGQVMIGFSEAAEYKTKYQHDINAALVMIEMLRRTPTTLQRDELSAALKGGQSLPATFAQIMATPEYRDRVT